MFTSTITAATWNEIERVGRLVAERDDAWAIPRVSAEFLHALVLAGGYRRGLEIGTSYGYSALWIGAALAHNGGLLTTIEMNAAKAALSREAFRRAGLAQTLTVVHGRAEDVVGGLEGPFDFVFLDAEKAGTRGYFDLVYPKLAHRATIVTDNVSSHAAELTEFVAHIRAHPRFCSVLLPVGSGLEVSVKLDPFAMTVTVDGADWVI